jgi:hypothetical protein
MGIRDFFSGVRNSFRAATSSNRAASDRNTSSSRSNPSTRTGRVTQNILSDIALGFGNKTGVSQAGIDDFNKRTAASKAAMEALQARNQNDSGSSSAPPPPPPVKVTPKPEPEPEPEPPAVTTDPIKLTPETPPDTSTEGENAPTTPDTGAGTTTAVGAEEEADTLEAGATGDAEADVADTIRKKGRRSTIKTTSKGLLTSAPTRSRRSLMGGGLLT